MQEVEASPSQQTLSGFIRQHLPVLEDRLYNGIRQEVIVGELSAKGFATTVPVFRVLLSRARARAALRPRRPSRGTADFARPEPMSEGTSTASPKPRNPLSRSSGFEYDSKIDPKDLI
ncbi:hypothetical protein QTI27_31785 [Variovorax sp. J31P216]|nr:hypothetical protein [Variovorax sp. J31P216]